MNVNYNNLYCDYIGATGAYSISDYIDNTSNILAINSSNFTSGTSNILNNSIKYKKALVNLCLLVYILKLKFSVASSPLFSYNICIN